MIFGRPLSAFVRKAMLLCGAMACVGIAAEANPAFAAAQSHEQAEVSASDKRLPEPEAEAQPAAPPPPKPVAMNRPPTPKGNPDNWMTQSYYPPILHPVEGTVGFTLTVDADGRPTGCVITNSSGNSELDYTTCKHLTRRVKFHPALENGIPVPSTYSNNVRWVIPRDPTPEPAAEPAAPPPPKPVGMNRPLMPRGDAGQWVTFTDYPPKQFWDQVEGTTAYTLTVGADGRPTGCAVTSSSGTAELDAATCVNLMKRARFNPMVVDGTAVPSTYSGTMRWEFARPPEVQPPPDMPPPAAKPVPKHAIPPPPKPVGPTSALHPKGRPTEWVPFSDYPAGPLRDRIEGTTGFTMTVGADGRPTGCTITHSSGNAELDAASCAGLMQRAEFYPRMENGVPVPSIYSNRVRWAIPRKPRPQPPTERPTP